MINHLSIVQYREICGLALQNEEVQVLIISGIIIGRRRGFPDAPHTAFEILRNGKVIAAFNEPDNYYTMDSDVCRTRALELAMPRDLVISGQGEYYGKTIKDLPSRICADLADMILIHRPRSA